MNDYAETLIECNKLLKEIYDASIKRNFEKARQLTETLNFLTQELSLNYGKLVINAKH